MESYFFTSDLHIRTASDPACVWLEDKIKNTRPGDFVFLLGDVFDLWIGKSILKQFKFRKLLFEIKEATTRGVTVTYCEGNHDFGIAKAFSPLGVKLVTDSGDITTASGLKIYYAHGDLVDKADRNYLSYRARARALLNKPVFRWMPSWMIDAIAQYYKVKLTPPVIVPFQALPMERQRHVRNAFHEFAREKILNENYDLVVLGHCHDLTNISIKNPLNDKTGHYVNLGYWNADKLCLQITESDILLSP